jgi:hypothetical protein
VNRHDHLPKLTLVAVGSERETQQGKVHHSVIGAAKVSLESGVVERHPQFSTARPYGNGDLGGVGLMALRCVFTVAQMRMKVTSECQ